MTERCGEVADWDAVQIQYCSSSSSSSSASHVPGNEIHMSGRGKWTCPIVTNSRSLQLLLHPLQSITSYETDYHQKKKQLNFRIFYWHILREFPNSSSFPQVAPTTSFSWVSAGEVIHTASSGFSHETASNISSTSQISNGSGMLEFLSACP